MSKAKRSSSTNKLRMESPKEAERAQKVFSRLGMPNAYKLDKTSYSRADVADIGIKVGKKLQDFEHMLEYERRKNEEIRAENAHLQKQIEMANL